MKKALTTIFLIIMIITVVGVAVVPQQAQASIWDFACLLSPSTCANLNLASDLLLMTLVANIGNVILQLSSWFLSVSGVLLNISVALTMNIKAIYQATPAIDHVWVVIRNLSSIFIIFSLLYMSIATILDLKKADVKGLVVRIIMAGLLINFSLFFTKAAIDASNLISLSFYRAIVPNSQNMNVDASGIGQLIKSSFSAGGLSNVFMHNLKINKIYNKTINQNGLLTEAQGSEYFKIAVSTIAGSALMIMAALSFLAASIAFIIRIVILLLLMGFSPIYFVGMIFPEIEQKVSKKWEGWLIAELTFMPVYLLFMYVALSFISTIQPGDKGGGFFLSIDKATMGSTASSGENGIMLYMIGIILQYTIAFILIYIPLHAAIQMGGSSISWGNTAKKWVGGKLGGFAGRNTAGRLGRALGDTFDSMATSSANSKSGTLKAATWALRTSGISQGVRGGLENMEKSKYGGPQNLSDIKKEDKDRSKEISGMQREKNQEAAITAFMQGHKSPLGIPTPNLVKNLGDQVSAMDTKEFEKLDMDTLLDPKFAAYIPTSKFEALVKSDNLTFQQQQELRKSRETGMSGILDKYGADYLLNKHMKGKSQDIAKLPKGIITKKEVAILLDPASLRKMVDENVSREDRQKIRDHIASHSAAAGTTTPASKYLNDPVGQIF